MININEVLETNKMIEKENLECPHKTGAYCLKSLPYGI